MNSGLRAYNEQNKLAQWVQIVSECRDSGMSVRQWCQEHGINISSYYRWQRKVYAMVQAVNSGSRATSARTFSHTLTGKQPHRHGGQPHS